MLKNCGSNSFEKKIIQLDIVIVSIYRSIVMENANAVHLKTRIQNTSNITSTFLKILENSLSASVIFQPFFPKDFARNSSYSRSSTRISCEYFLFLLTQSRYQSYTQL